MYGQGLLQRQTNAELHPASGSAKGFFANRGSSGQALHWDLSRGGGSTGVRGEVSPRWVVVKEVEGGRTTSRTNTP